MSRHHTAASVLGMLLLAASANATAPLQKLANSKACQDTLDGLLLNKRLVAKVTFPASVAGIDLNLEGKWNPKFTTTMIKQRGIGIDIDEPATVTTLKLKDGLLEIHLNGGGFGSTFDLMTSGKSERRMRSTESRAPGGSRINLKFNRPVTCEELTDASRLMAYLEPLVDSSSLKRDVAKQAVAPEWAEAAAQKRLVEGMDKATVFAIVGEPKNKTVDLNADTPIEKWQYDLPNLKTRVVTFREGKVIKVDEF